MDNESKNIYVYNLFRNQPSVRFICGSYARENLGRGLPELKRTGINMHLLVYAFVVAFSTRQFDMVGMVNIRSLTAQNRPNISV